MQKKIINEPNNIQGVTPQGLKSIQTPQQYQMILKIPKLNLLNKES